MGKKIIKNKKNILRTFAKYAITDFMNTNAPTRILGIDPGLTHCGWGVIDVVGSRLIYSASGTIIPPKNPTPMADRLHGLLVGLQQVITQNTPHTVAVEEVFVNKNPDSTLRLGQARGVALVAPAMAGLPVSEYQNRMVKKSVVGNGNATKEQIHMMVRTLLPTATPDSEHSADALAIAITHANLGATQSAWEKQQESAQ